MVEGREVVSTVGDAVGEKPSECHLGQRFVAFDGVRVVDAVRFVINSGQVDEGVEFRLALANAEGRGFEIAAEFARKRLALLALLVILEVLDRQLEEAREDEVALRRPTGPCAEARGSWSLP